MTSEPIVTEQAILARDWRRRAAPFYSVHEVAKVFFAKSPSWIRLKMSTQPERPLTSFVQDGQAMEFRRRDPQNEASARVFTLADIQPMAESLRDFGDIDAGRLAQILRVVQAQADLFDLTGPAGQDETGD